jgi:hypothetical protein
MMVAPSCSRAGQRLERLVHHALRIFEDQRQHGAARRGRAVDDFGDFSRTRGMVFCSGQKQVTMASHTL